MSLFPVFLQSVANSRALTQLTSVKCLSIIHSGTALDNDGNKPDKTHHFKLTKTSAGDWGSWDLIEEVTSADSSAPTTTTIDSYDSLGFALQALDGFMTGQKTEHGNCFTRFFNGTSLKVFKAEIENAKMLWGRRPNKPRPNISPPSHRIRSRKPRNDEISRESVPQPQ